MLFKIPAKSLGRHEGSRSHVFQRQVAVVVLHDEIVDITDAHALMVAEIFGLHIGRKRAGILQTTQ